jgi:hypothetical protein
MNNIKLVDAHEWMLNEKVTSVFLCQTPFSISEVEALIGFDFQECEQDGLGMVYSCFLVVDDKKLLLKGFLSKEQKDEPVYVEMHGDEASPEEVLERVLNILLIKREQLTEIGKYMSPPKFSLTRLDDNNNEVEISRFHDSNMAEYLRKKYEDKGHKQTYCVTEIIDKHKKN